MTSQCRTPLTFSAHQKPTVGDSKFSAATSDHLGWMLCDGRTVTVSDFQFLFTGQYKFTPLSFAEERKFYDGSQSRINKALTKGEGLN